MHRIKQESSVSCLTHKVESDNKVITQTKEILANDHRQTKGDDISTNISTLSYSTKLDP